MRAAYSLGGVVGVVLILLALFVIGPIAIFAGGGIWSALMGWESSEDAEASAGGAQDSEASA
jgi:hypothetical protein